MNEMANLFWGKQEFQNSQELQELIKQYENATSYTFGKNDSRTITTHCKNLEINVDEYLHLGYYYRYMHCSRGGRYIEKKKQGVKSRKIQSNKIGCPVQLYVTANLKKKVLIVRKWVSNHNHSPEKNTGVSNESNDEEKSDSSDEDEDCSSGNEAVANEKEPKNVDATQNEAKECHSISQILKKIKKSIDCDEDTAPAKIDMILDLAKKFSKLDEDSIKAAEELLLLDDSKDSEHSDDESTHRDLSPTRTNSPLHLEFPVSPNDFPLAINHPASRNTSGLRLNHSPSISHLTLRQDSSSEKLSSFHESEMQESSVKSSINAEKADVKNMTPHIKSKRQKKPAISSDFYTYGITKAKKKL